MRHLITIAAAGLCLAFGISPAAATTVVPACAFAYPTVNVNGTTSFPGTFVGTVGTGDGQICQIGNIATNNVSGNGAYVASPSPTSSIYEFYWGGGVLQIQEKIGNNGTTGHPAIDVELDALAAIGATAPSSVISSIQIPFSSGPSAFYTVANQYLGSGYYAIDTYLAIGNVEDPTFQINFTPGPARVPEPASDALVLIALGGLVAARRRPKRGSTPRAAH